MKNIYKFRILFLFAVLILNSCAINDDDPVVAPSTTTITASIPDRVTRIDIADTNFNLTVNLSAPVSQLTRVTYTLDGTEMTADVNSGASAIQIPVDMSNDFVRTVKITKLQSLYSSVENLNTLVSETDNETKIVKGLSTVVFTFTWNDDSDLDCGTITRAPLAAIDLSAGVTSVETCVLPDNIGDGTYYFAILPWTVHNDPIECYVEVINGNTIQTYTGNLVGAQPAGFFGYNTIEDFLKLEKASGVVTITNML